MESPKILLEDISELENTILFEERMACVPASRREKVLRFRHESDRCLSLGVGFLLIRALVRDGLLASPKDGAGLRIETTRKGKPFLPDFPDYYFSLSHSGTKVLCVTGNHPVGCDLEQTGRADLKIARRFFSSEEWKRIQDSGKPEEVFTRIWTLKESYLKAVGDGLLRPMNTFTVVPEDPPVVLEDPACRMGMIHAGEGYRASWVILEGFRP